MDDPADACDAPRRSTAPRPRCDVVFVNSAYTGRDAVERLGVAEERIHVAHPGVDPVFTAEGEPADLGKPYVLTVATLEPRKNLGTLVDAWRLLDRDETSLAVVGGAGWGAQPKLDHPGVIRLGRVDDLELARLYRGAAAVVYPSRFEGFGMPIVEAMACGAPVVASAHPSMDEAAGDAAVRADPDSPEAMAAAIRQALARRDDLVPRGLEHARRFTWRAVGETFLAAWEERGGEGRRWTSRRSRRRAPARRATCSGLLRHLDVEPLSFGGAGRG